MGYESEMYAKMGKDRQKTGEDDHQSRELQTWLTS